MYADEDLEAFEREQREEYERNQYEQEEKVKPLRCFLSKDTIYSTLTVPIFTEWRKTDSLYFFPKNILLNLDNQCF